MPYKKIIEDYQKIINDELKKYLQEERPEIIYEAMNYSVFAGGKRIRPLLMMASCEAFSKNTEKCIPFACALEMIHTYSLIHDDLPAMDDDDFRRGKLTNHKVYGEAIALLAGDGLLNKAFEIMSECCFLNPNENNIRAMHKISLSAGTKGMIGGQVVDILSENKNIDHETLRYIHKNKTSALFEASLYCGAVLSNQSDSVIEEVTNVGMKIGIAFQIKDDILDVISTKDVLGKSVNSDQNNNKSTYVSIYGLEKSIEDYDFISKEVCNDIEKIIGKDNLLFYLADYLINRIK